MYEGFEMWVQGFQGLGKKGHDRAEPQLSVENHKLNDPTAQKQDLSV